MRGAPGAGLDGGGAGIAGGRADDRDRPAAFLQKMLEQVAQQLQRDVLEGERRPVEQLEQPVVGVELAQGRHGDVIEAGICLVDQSAQLGLAQGTFDERGENGRGDLLIGSAAQGVQPVAIEARPALRQIKAAVGGKPIQQGLLEVARRHAAAAAHVADGHGGRNLARPARRRQFRNWLRAAAQPAAAVSRAYATAGPVTSEWLLISEFARRL